MKTIFDMATKNVETAKETIFVYLKSRIFSDEVSEIEKEQEIFEEEFPFMTLWYLEEEIASHRLCENWSVSTELFRRNCECARCDTEFARAEYPEWWRAMYAVNLLKKVQEARMAE